MQAQRDIVGLVADETRVEGRDTVGVRAVPGRNEVNMGAWGGKGGGYPYCRCMMRLMLI